MISSDWVHLGMVDFNELMESRVHKLQEHKALLHSYAPRLMKLESLQFDYEKSLDFYLAGITEFCEIVDEIIAKNPVSNKAERVLLETSIVDIFIAMKSFLERRHFILFLKRNLIKSLNQNQHDKMTLLLTLMGKSSLIVHFEYDIINICTNYIAKSIANYDFNGLLSILNNEILEGLKSKFALEGLLLDRISVTLSRFAIKSFCCHHSKHLYDYIASSDRLGMQQLAAIANDTDLLDLIWKNFEHDLDSHLLHVGVATKIILGHLELGIAGLSTVDPSHKLLEKYLKKLKSYLIGRRKDYPIEVLKMIEHFANGRLRNEFLNPISKVKYDIPDLDPRNFDSLILADIRASTKSENIFAILANFFDSSVTFVNTYKRMLVHEAMVEHLPLEKSVCVS
jgi:hypothetical protein